MTNIRTMPIDVAVDAKRWLQDFDDATVTVDDPSERLTAAKNALKDAVESGLVGYKARMRGSSFLQLPSEIRNLVYEYILVEPYQGYVKCDFQDTGNNVEGYANALWCRAELHLFCVNRQINIEASSIFYGRNTFAIAERQDYLYWPTAKRIDACRIARWHISTRDCRWKSNPLRCSPRIFRETGKLHIALLGKALEKPHQVRYLLIDCLSGFGASARMVMNDLRPLEGITGIKQVHIVSRDKDHHPYLRYLEKSMMDKNEGFQRRGQWLLRLIRGSFLQEDPTEHIRLGNDLARILKVTPCYDIEDKPGKQ